MATDTTIRGWAEQLASATPTLDPEQQRIALQIYRPIAETAGAVAVAQIADRAGVTASRVEEGLRSWSLVLWDDQDRVVG